MCSCLGDRICGYHFDQIASLYRLLLVAERGDTGMQEPLRLTLAEYGSRADTVILAVESGELA